MSEFHVEVVRVGAVEKHPNADTLSITRVHGGYPVIFRTGDYVEGDRAVYVPVDSLVPTTREPFAFLGTVGRELERIRAKRLRGIFSMGLLVPAPAEWADGQDVALELGVTKYEPPEPSVPSGAHESARDPGILPVYDLEGYRRWGDVLQVGEDVVITEKLHGANGRAVWHEGELKVASRNLFKTYGPEATNWWARAARGNCLFNLFAFPEIAVYFEVIGVQDLRYGVESGTVDLRVFDVLDLKERRWLNYDDARAICKEGGWRWVPELYRGPWSPGLTALAEGKSDLADHVREGIVIKPTTERRDDRIGRVVLKLHGEGYLTRKGA